MKVKIPVIIQDQMVSAMKGMEPTETITIDEDFFLDGPICARVALLDFDEDGSLRPGVRFRPAADGQAAHFENAHPDDHPDIHSDAFIQVNAFGTVLNTIAMFEEPDALGRRLDWAFDAPQLLVIPRGGELRNAYYERDSHSLQFFYFDSQRRGYEGDRVHTSLSRDIVSHETGHAVLDAIAPDLYNAITPQSLALHEAVSDLTALMISLRSPALRKEVLRATRGTIGGTSAFNAVAEEFGGGDEQPGVFRPLRSLKNDKKLSHVSPTSPHKLSEVLTGALYSALVRLHEHHKEAFARTDGGNKLDVAERALEFVSEMFKRLAFRALDYLPPGEVSFADYGRAIIAADEASHPYWKTARNWIAEELVDREIVSNVGELDTAADHAELNAALEETDLLTLVRSDWAAYEFANRLRGPLGIPDDIPIRVRPRLKVTKSYLSEDSEGRKRITECIFKVSWDHVEQNPGGLGFPPERQVTLGTMLAILWPGPGDDRKPHVRALLTTRAHAQKGQRDEMLRRLRADGRIRIGDEAIGPDGRPLRSSVIAETTGDLLRVRSSARMLHIDGAEDEG